MDTYYDEDINNVPKEPKIHVFKVCCFRKIFFHRAEKRNNDQQNSYRGSTSIVDVIYIKVESKVG